MRRVRKVLKDDEFKRLLAAAIIDISYCAMYPNVPYCQEDDFPDDDYYCEEVVE